MSWLKARCRTVFHPSLVLGVLAWLAGSGLEAPGEGARAPFQLSATQTRYLPPEMYGEWSVTATLVETNVQNLLPPVVHDLWTLERNGDEVTITNPANGATAAVEVDRVAGNTATFHRTVRDGKNRVFRESPTVTVQKDSLQGETLMQYERLREGNVHKRYTARYRLEAERIHGARTRFGPPDPVEFEIEEIRPGR